MSDIKKSHKEILAAARIAREEITASKNEFAKWEKEYGKQLRERFITDKGYAEMMESVRETMRKEIESSVGRVTRAKTAAIEELQKKCRLDGTSVDAGVIALLNSGIKFSAAEMQVLADQFKDNYTMTRILREKWEPMKREIETKNNKYDLKDGFYTQSFQPEKTEVRFGQDPAEQIAAINTLANVLEHSAQSGTIVGKHASQNSYWNSLVRESLEKCQYVAEPDELDRDFPMEFSPEGTFNGTIF